MVRVRPAVLLAVLIVLASLPGVRWAGADAGERPAGTLALSLVQQPADDFVPVSQLPETDQLPAAPLLIAAYVVVWLVVLVYLLSLWRRMAAVDREIADVERRLTDQRRS
jgi:CcmD family protein